MWLEVEIEEDLLDWCEEQIEKGRYESLDALVEAALELLMTRHAILTVQVEGDALLAQMQEPEHLAAMDALWNATSEELGHAAVLGLTEDSEDANLDVDYDYDHDYFE